MTRVRSPRQITREMEEIKAARSVRSEKNKTLESEF